MGYTTILDILGSMFIGGILLLSLKQVNYNVVMNAQFYNVDFLLQRQLFQDVQILERDIKRIAYTKGGPISPQSNAIPLADTSALTLVGDVDATNSSKTDTIAYYLGATSELSSTTNPNDRILYRRVNNQTPIALETGVTQFRFLYMNSLNDTLATPMSSAAGTSGQIASIQVAIRLESGDSYNEQFSASDRKKYAQVYWRQITLIARNLNK
ncbi:MAG: hypothetical protein LWX56_05365 [Ignavibacteria bacterium]|nr:hypothetical protein [Ignavibacteria bacterium]